MAGVSSMLALTRAGAGWDLTGPAGAYRFGLDADGEKYFIACNGGELPPAALNSPCSPNSRRPTGA